MALERTYLTFGIRSLLQDIDYGEKMAGAPWGGRGRFMISVWISKPVVSGTEEEAMSLSVLYHHDCAVTDPDFQIGGGGGGGRPDPEIREGGPSVSV